MAANFEALPAHSRLCTAGVLDILDDARETLRANSAIANALALSGVDSPEALVELSHMASSCEAALATARGYIERNAKRVRSVRTDGCLSSKGGYALVTL